MASIAGKLKQKDNRDELFKDLLTAEDCRPAYKRKHTKDVNQLMLNKCRSIYLKLYVI